MGDELDRSLAVDVLAASLWMDQQESGDLLEFLAQKLERSLPQNTTVTRGGGLFSKGRPVKDITVQFSDYHYQIVRESHGAFRAKVMKLVRGVILKTTEVPVEQWVEGLAAELAQLAQHNAQTRDALNRFVIGGG
jgi:hypothetical protein